MRRTLLFMVLLLTVGSVSADAGKKLTNSDLKQLTSKMFFAGGYSRGFNVSYHVTWFPNGTRDVYWHEGITGHTEKSKWWLKGDTVCIKNEHWVSEKCDQWRKNGDRIETWGNGVMNGYFYVLR